MQGGPKLKWSRELWREAYQYGHTYGQWARRPDEPRGGFHDADTAYEHWENNMRIGIEPLRPGDSITPGEKAAFELGYCVGATEKDFQLGLEEGVDAKANTNLGRSPEKIAEESPLDDAFSGDHHRVTAFIDGYLQAMGTPKRRARKPYLKAYGLWEGKE